MISRPRLGAHASQRSLDMWCVLHLAVSTRLTDRHRQIKDWSARKHKQGLLRLEGSPRKNMTGPFAPELRITLCLPTVTGRHWRTAARLCMRCRPARPKMHDRKSFDALASHRCIAVGYKALRRIRAFDLDVYAPLIRHVPGCDNGNALRRPSRQDPWRSRTSTEPHLFGTCPCVSPPAQSSGRVFTCFSSVLLVYADMPACRTCDVRYLYPIRAAMQLD